MQVQTCCHAITRTILGAVHTYYWRASGFSKVKYLVQEGIAPVKWALSVELINDQWLANSCSYLYMGLHLHRADHNTLKI